jgi:hypothetical protein
MKQFKCNDSGVLTEYIGNKIEHVGEDAIQLVQTVLTQSYENEFKLGNRCYNTPAPPGMVLMHPVKGKELIKPEDQTTLRSGVGKLICSIQGQILLRQYKTWRGTCHARTQRCLKQ